MPQPRRKPISKKFYRLKGEYSLCEIEPFLFLRLNGSLWTTWERSWREVRHTCMTHAWIWTVGTSAVLPFSCWFWPMTVSSLGLWWLLLNNQDGVGIAHLRAVLLRGMYRSDPQWIVITIIATYNHRGSPASGIRWISLETSTGLFPRITICITLNYNLYYIFLPDVRLAVSRSEPLSLHALTKL